MSRKVLPISLAVLAVLLPSCAESGRSPAQIQQFLDQLSGAKSGPELSRLLLGPEWWVGAASSVPVTASYDDPPTDVEAEDAGVLERRGDAATSSDSDNGDAIESCSEDAQPDLDTVDSHTSIVPTTEATPQASETEDGDKIEACSVESNPSAHQSPPWGRPSPVGTCGPRRS